MSHLSRPSAINMSSDEFRQAGHRLVDDIGSFLDRIAYGPVTTGESPQALQQLLSQPELPENGTGALELIAKASDILFNHSLFNGHPKFLGYITSSPAPIGMLAELLAAAVNANVGAYVLSAAATEIEKQTIQWLGQFIGLKGNFGGILVSGGNMANFTGFLAARTAKIPADIKQSGVSRDQKPVVYC